MTKHVHYVYILPISVVYLSNPMHAGFVDFETPPPKPTARANACSTSLAQAHALALALAFVFFYHHIANHQPNSNSTFTKEIRHGCNNNNRLYNSSWQEESIMTRDINIQAYPHHPCMRVCFWSFFKVPGTRIPGCFGKLMPLDQFQISDIRFIG